MSGGADAGTSGRSTNAPSDRRLARGHLTRMLLVQAMIELIQEGNLRPTCRQLADRAGTSIRTLFNHFHIDALLGDAAAETFSRHRVLVVPPHGPIDSRIRATCHQRRELFEDVGPMLRVAQTRVELSPGLIDALGGLHTLLQQQVALTFGPEISSGGPDAPVLLEHLDLITGWQSWAMLRDLPGRTASSAERAMVAFVTQALA
jgi:AcrR family transcriptional regulator